MKKLQYIVYIVLFLGIAAGCGPKYASIPSQEFPAKEYKGQVPANVLQEASRRYDGSIETGSQEGPSDQAIRVIIGPIKLERMTEKGPISSDSGQQIREIVAQSVNKHPRLTLIDAPKERFIDDSPRPDLAKRSIRYVLKGTASSSQTSGKINILLRMVATKNGEVAYMARGQSQNLDDAAIQAANRMINKIVEVQ
ncbi:hypothetical protein QUF90_21835 [Desulfococcaceae bacterium HSG9]|nr:hypothetical protein [Desulfococcaceae bacterium HSG9]